jgi:hypothetical protein
MPVHNCRKKLSWIWRKEYIYLLLIFCSFFLWNVLVVRAQYLPSGAELDYGCLAEITLTQYEIILYNVQPQILMI